MGLTTGIRDKVYLFIFAKCDCGLVLVCKVHSGLGVTSGGQKREVKHPQGFGLFLRYYRRYRRLQLTNKGRKEIYKGNHHRNDEYKRNCVV